MGVFKQHNTAHNISKGMYFILNHKFLGILIGNVGSVFQTGLDQFFALLVSIVLQRTDLRLSEVIDAGAFFPRISFQNVILNRDKVINI